MKSSTNFRPTLATGFCTSGKSTGLITRLVFSLCFVIAVSCLLAENSSAQRRSRPSVTNGGNTSNNQTQQQRNKQAQEKKKPKVAAKKPKPGEKVSPEAENVVIEVKGEGVLLAATYFGPPTIPVPKTIVGAGANESGDETGKTVSPFILLHDWEGDRREMLPLAKFLQSSGHAVLVPDLRGHGESVQLRGSNKPLDYSKFKKNEIASALGDIEQCKRFLREKNDLAEVNIDLLNVVAVGDTSHLAVQWAISDWSWPSIGSKKQGQDVKSLVLISPTKKFSSSSMLKLAKAPVISGAAGSALPMMMVWGKGSVANEDCTDIYDALAKRRPASESRNPVDIWREQDLFKVTPATRMTGQQIIQSRDAKPIWNYIANFTAQKVVAHADKCPWKVRGKKKPKKK